MCPYKLDDSTTLLSLAFVSALFLQVSKSFESALIGCSGSSCYFLVIVATMRVHYFIQFVLALLCSRSVVAFVPLNPPIPATHGIQTNAQHMKTAPMTTTTLVQPFLPRQRRSVAPLYGLFGLGAPEIAVILIAAAFLLGPQKLAELGKDAGKIAGELKEVPKEFQAGLKEGEQTAQMAKQQTDKALDTTTTVAVVDEKKE
jgi:sec-independent protein translocase protein TatA